MKEPGGLMSPEATPGPAWVGKRWFPGRGSGKKALSDKLTLEQGPEWNEELSHEEIWRESIPVERTANSKPIEG